jgi:hypothetical protein
MIFKHCYRKEEQGSRAAGICFLYFMCLAAYLALPVSCVLLGKGIHFYHFYIVFVRVSSLILLVFCLYALDLSAAIFAKNIEQLKLNYILVNIFRKGSVFLVIFFCMVSMFKNAYSYTMNKQQMLSPFASEWKALVNYRTDFVAVIKELSKKEYRDCKILGTFDPQLSSWWISFKHGYAYIADPFITTVSDAEIESRLIYFCKVVGMNAEDFRSFVNRFYVNAFWLAHNKYQASQAYTFAPIWDYEESMQKKIKETSILDSWRIAIPTSEQRRLVNQFNIKDAQDNNRRLDLVILTSDESLKDFTPPEDTFVFRYSNSTFRVWKRK